MSKQYRSDREYHCRGGCICNGNEDSICYAEISTPDGSLLHREFMRGGTSNSAQYLAVIETLKLTRRNEIAVIYTDSKLIVDQIYGSVPVRSRHLKEYQRNAKRILSRRPHVLVQWMGRAKLEMAFANKAKEKSFVEYDGSDAVCHKCKKVFSLSQSNLALLRCAEQLDKNGYVMVQDAMAIARFCSEKCFCEGIVSAIADSIQDPDLFRNQDAARKALTQLMS